jgi:hypothetical protein
MLHYSNAPAKSTQCIREFLTKYNISLVLPPPPHTHTHTLFSPHMEPNDFSILTKFKSTPNKKRFHKVPEIMQDAYKNWTIFSGRTVPEVLQQAAGLGGGGEQAISGQFPSVLSSYRKKSRKTPITRIHLKSCGLKFLQYKINFWKLVKPSRF